MIAKDFAQQLFDLHDRVAFVTGAGSGIGQMIALALASAGARVVCFDLREDGGLKETVNHIEALGGQALYYTGDVRELRDLRAAVALAKTHFGRLDIAVNAAGIANANPALEMESEQWQRVIDINLTGVWNSCKAEAELMVENGGGSIINIASMSGIIVNRGLEQAHYNSSKAGVIHLSKSLAMEWVSKGIRVNSISPGYTATPMIHDLKWYIRLGSLKARRRFNGWRKWKRWRVQRCSLPAMRRRSARVWIWWSMVALSAGKNGFARSHH